VIKQKFLIFTGKFKREYCRLQQKAEYFFAALLSIKTKLSGNKFIMRLINKNNIKALAGLIAVFVICFSVLIFYYSKEKISIYIDGQYKTECYISFNETVSDILRKTGIEISYNDFVYPYLSDTVGQKGRIDIYKPAEVVVYYQNQAYSVTTPLTGENAVKQAGLTVDEDDIINADASSNVLKVYSKDTAHNNKIIEIKHDTKIIKNDKEYVDYKKIITEGKDGKALALTVTTFIDGKAINEEQHITKLIDAPVTEVVEVGTKLRPNSILTASGYELYSKTYTANITAYCPCSICCGKYSNGYTANGRKASQYYTIAAPKNIPFGTRIYIPYFKNYPNKGIFVVQDRGGAISDNRLDIYYESHSKALSFGRKKLKIYILE